MTYLVPGLQPTRDHVFPKARGGKEIQIVCDDCNHVKNDRTPEEWAAFMLANPCWWEQRVGNRRPATIQEEVSF